MAENSPLLELRGLYADGRVLSLTIPAAWVQPIEREESAWIDVYDTLEQ